MTSHTIKMQVVCKPENLLFLSFSWARLLTPEITVILFTRGLPYVQCTKNRLTCENNKANYKIFQEHQLNSRRFPVFPEVAGTLYNRNTFNAYPVICQSHRIHRGIGPCAVNTLTCWSTMHSGEWDLQSTESTTDSTARTICQTAGRKPRV